MSIRGKRIVSVEFANFLERQGHEKLREFLFEKNDLETRTEITNTLHGLIHEAGGKFPNEYISYVLKVSPMQEHHGIEALCVFCTKNGEYVVRWMITKIAYDITSREWIEEES